MTKDSGFTLIELIIIITIIGILLAVAVPGFVQWIPKYRVKDAAQDLYSNFQMAKMEAIRRNQNCTVTFETGPDRYQVSLINKTVQLGDYGSGVQYTAAPAPAVITFNPRGFTDNALTVSLTNDANSATYQISVLISGVITVN